MLINHYHTLTPKVLRNWVTSHIHVSINQSIVALHVAAAKQLRSRDLAIYTQTVAEKEALQTSPNWASTFGACKVVTTTYGVIAHGIPTTSIKMDDQKQTIARIQAENHKISTNIPIGYVGWLCPPKRAAGSMVVEFLDAEQANLALQTGLVWDSEYKKTELYDRACWIQECFRCHKYGHISAQCGGQQKCGICAEEHRSEDCPSKDLGKRKCASCGGPHKARDSKCPNYQKEVARVQVAHSVKWTHWRVPSTKAQTAPTTPAFTATPAAPQPESTPNDRCPVQSRGRIRARENAIDLLSSQGRVSGCASAPSKASVVRALERAPILPTLKPKPTLNVNGKRPASPTKTAANRMPLGPTTGNRRSKHTTMKSLKQRSMGAEEEAAISVDIWEVPNMVEPASTPAPTSSAAAASASITSEAYPMESKDSMI